MANGGNKTQAGPSGARTVVRLNPIRYQIKLYYLGPDRVTRDATYRCKCELFSGETADPAATPLSALTVIENIISGDAPAAEAIAAATFLDQGGDHKNPPGDSVIRITPTDNHAIPASDLQRLLGPDADAISKVDHYQQSGWLPDISPAVPFRVVVRKFSEGTQIPLDVPVRLVIELKDPPEELQVHPVPDPNKKTARRTFIEKFFAKHNHASSDPSEGGDNCATEFGGKRNGSASKGAPSGVDLIKLAPYTAPPAIDEPNQTPGPITFGALTAATAHAGTQRVVLDLTKVPETVNKKPVDVGVVDFAFLPWPAGGDNYRFLMTLVDASDQDVRARKEKNKAVSLVDHARNDIPSPQAYTTGRFVMWRRIDVRLLATVNDTSSSTIKLDHLRSMYAKAFIDLRGPQSTVKISRSEWEAALKQVFPDAAKHPTMADATAMEKEFKANLFPSFLHPKLQKDGSARTRELTRALLEGACQSTSLAPKISPPPTQNAKQSNSDGLFVLVCKSPMAGIEVGGEYIGDRMFWMVEGANSSLTTMIAAHEVGHALYLRHSYDADLRFVATVFNKSTVSEKGEKVVMITSKRPSRSFTRDHDQADALACLMSQIRPTGAEPCGACCLALRFYDRVKLTAKNNSQLMDGLTPARVARVEHPAAGRVQIFKQPVDMSGSQEQFFLAMGPRMEFTTEANQKFVGHVILTRGDDQTAAQWTSSGDGALKLDLQPQGMDVPPNSVSARVSKRGKVKLNFSWNGVSDSSPEFQAS